MDPRFDVAKTVMCLCEVDPIALKTVSYPHLQFSYAVGVLMSLPQLKIVTYIIKAMQLGGWRGYPRHQQSSFNSPIQWLRSDSKCSFYK
jgi:hypothetical protein